MATLIDIQNLAKSYTRGKQKVEVLHHVDLTIAEGDFLALMGPSGSGKTTLLNLIGGLDAPSAGSISVGGQRIDQLGGGALAKCATSYARSMNTLRANCEKGWYELDPFQSYSGVQGRTSSGMKLAASPLNQQATQMDNDALSILHNLPIAVPGEEGMRDIAILEAIFKAAKTGKRITL